MLLNRNPVYSFREKSQILASTSLQQLYGYTTKDLSVVIYDTSRLQRIMSHRLHRSIPRALAFVDDSYLISGGDDKRLIKYSLIKKEKVLESVKQARVLSSKFEPSRGLLISSLSNDTISIDIHSSLQEIGCIRFEEEIAGIEIFDHNSIIAAGKSGEMKIFDLRKTNTPVIEAKHETTFTGVQVNRSGREAIFGLGAGIKVFDKELRLRDSLHPSDNDASLRACCFDSKRDLIITGGFEGRLHIVKYKHYK